jgi:hypothetical protein
MNIIKRQPKVPVKVEVISVEFDFSGSGMPVLREQELIDNSKCLWTVRVPVGSETDEQEVGDALVETISELTGFCINSVIWDFK